MVAGAPRVFISRLAGVAVFDPAGDQVGRVRDVVVIVAAGALAVRAVIGAEHAPIGVAARARGDLALGEAVRHVAARAGLVTAGEQRARPDDRARRRVALDASMIGGAGGFVRSVAV